LSNNFKSVLSRRQFSEVARKCIKLRDRRPAVVEQRTRNAALEAKAAASGLEWRTVGATYVINTRFDYSLLNLEVVL
jgi:hypothetical protein